MLVLLLLVGTCTILFYVYATWTFRYWSKKKVPGPKPAPLLGNIADIVTLKLTPGECHQKIYRQYPDEQFVGIYQLQTPTLLLRDPELIKQILVKDFDHFPDRGHNYDEAREPLTANLINLEDGRWRPLRHRLTPTFSSGKLKTMFPLMFECSEQLVKFIQVDLDTTQDDVMEMREAMARFTTDVIGTVAFGLEFGAMSAPQSPLRNMGREVFQPNGVFAVSKAVRSFFPKIYSLLALRSYPNKVNNFFISVVKDTICHREVNNIQRNDLLQLMMDLRDKDIDAMKNGTISTIVFTEKMIAAQAFAFFTAGFETSSSTISFCLHELALHPQIQTQARQEVQMVLTKYGSLTYEAILEMSYLEKILLETMRKYPTISTLSRICTKTYQIPGTKTMLDKGVNIIVPIYALHHDHAYFPEPHRFLPERFNKENVANRHSYTYLPFGEGPRVCIGQRFALLEMKLGLSQLLRKYKVELSDRSERQLSFNPCTPFVLSPTHGIWLKVSHAESLNRMETSQ